MHEVDIFGQRLAERLGHRFDTTVGDEPPTDLRLDLLLQLVGARLVLVTGETLLEVRRGLAVFVLLLLEQPFEHTIDVEIPQRAVQVVGAADRAARLHAGVPLDGLAGDSSHHLLITAHERLVEHLGQLFGREVLASTTLLVAAALLVALLVVVHLRQLDQFVADLVLVTAQREIDLEDRLEGLPVVVVLDQRCGECVLERLAILERHMADRLHRIEILREADR